MSSREFPQHSVGADAHIGPLESCEFPEDFRKNGAICRNDVGIDPYAETVSAYVCDAAFHKNQLHSAGRTEASAPTKQSYIDLDRTFLTR